MAVHLYGQGESGAMILRADVVEIAMGRVTAEIDHVNDTLVVDRELRLDPMVRYSNRVHGLNPFVVFAGSSG
jgi:hypothetical protein